MKHIVIGHGDTATQKLELTNHGNADIKGGQKINWEIDSVSNVKFFRLVRKFPNTNPNPNYPFTHNPETSPTTSLTLRSLRKILFDWEYSIKWREIENGPEYTHDPIISIRPTFTISFKMVTAFITALLLSIFMFSKLFKKKINK